MNLFDKFIHQTALLVNEGLRPLGVQILNSSQVDELNAYIIPAVAGTMRLPEVFVETGTYLGNTTAGAAFHFREVHTVELSDELFKKAQKRFENVSNVTCHHGSSPDVLRKLAPKIKEPVLFYLDAHWSGGVTAHGEVEVPLLEELEIIRNRNYDDIIAIDDLRLIGKSGTTGLRLSKEYPSSSFDWRDVTMDAILEKLGRPTSVRECADKLLIDLKQF